MWKSVVCGVIFSSLIVSAARAESYVFSGSDSGGTGSAMIDFQFVGNQVIATIDNTSPLLLDNGSGDNAPGITGFGFDFLPSTSSLIGWELTALDSNLNSIQINDTSSGGTAGGTGDWTLSQPGSFGGPWTFDFVPETTRAVQGALYNSGAVGSSELAALPNFFTTAVLTLDFDQVITGFNFATSNNPTVRMQNVGRNGGGSLKLTGTPGGGPPNPSPSVPEPSSLVLLGIGLMSMAGYGWRRKRSTSLPA